MSFWGWIPILTRSVLFEYFIERLEQNGWEKASEEEIDPIKQILKTDKIQCYRNYDYEDANNKKFKAIIGISDYKIIHVFMYNSEGINQVHAECTIDNDGMIEIKLNSHTTSIEVAKRIYILIRNIYHSHTHHGAYDDLLLRPVFADNKKEAIEKILNLYEKKIIEYHRMIKDDIEKEKDFPLAIKFITKSNGEMAYALAFTELNKLLIKEPESYNFIFSNSLQSINFLSKETELLYNNSLTRSLNGLTIAILVLTFPMAIDAINKIFEKVEVINMIIIIAYIAFLLFVAFKLKLFILQEMNLIYQTTINILKKLNLPIKVILIIGLIILIIIALPSSIKQLIIDFIQATK